MAERNADLAPPLVLSEQVHHRAASTDHSLAKYVASLYLEHLSTDAEQIIRSPETKVLIVRFERNVSDDDARKAWHDGLENNCAAPCHLVPEDVEKSLAGIPAMHTGDNYSLLFTQQDAAATVSGHLIGKHCVPAPICRGDVGYVPRPQAGVTEAEARVARTVSEH
jgi:hypothetical protein